jgi:Domain of unknown function DUF29
MTRATYATDFYAWTQEQAAAFRDKNWAALDREHLAEEIDRVGTSVQRAMGQQLQRLLLHLLKWCYQPTHRTPSWRTSVMQARAG